jgi:hypothetical protein
MRNLQFELKCGETVGAESFFFIIVSSSMFSSQKLFKKLKGDSFHEKTVTSTPLQ